MAGAVTTGDMDPDPRCRACLLKASPMAPNVFEPWNNGNSTIAIDLAKLTGVVISETDPYSKKMCHSCCSKLHSACAFVHMVQDSDRELKELFKDISTGERWPKPIQLDKNVNDAVFGNVQDVEIKQEVLSDDDNFDANGADDYNPDLDIKIEPEEITQPTSIKITVNGTISLQDMNAQQSISNSSGTYENEGYLVAPVKAEPMSEDEQDLPMECLLCAKQFMSISGLKAHVIAQHNYKTVRRKMNNSASPEKLKNCSGKPKLPENVTKPVPHPPLPTTVKTQNESPVTLKCLNCNEEFSDLYCLKVHSEIHNLDNKVNNKNNQLQNTEQLNSGDVNILECGENSEQTTELDVVEQTNDVQSREIEIKLEITNVVTLKDQLDCLLDNSKNNYNEQIKEEANNDLNIHNQLESFESGKTPEILENCEKDNTVNNNEQLINDSDLIGLQCLKSFDVDEEIKTRVDQDENRVVVFENNEHFKVEVSKTSEDDLMVNNKNKDDNDLAKIMLLETDA
ncbi:uncharacterized protein LOC113233113 isoform X2 [Hyposmocoma kahamanoa]|uniref:uncharacterized protein LOC113233113 isoform X2 n=1 Tax=Hyposmocoma kahamanoa TaxID=1477025 RepID=UPI000E6D8AB8|nr:uncharacterized protein LOC113233113 isoform X2 [Hyposmocoma kahamanoa]